MAGKRGKRRKRPGSVMRRFFKNKLLCAGIIAAVLLLTAAIGSGTGIKGALPDLGALGDALKNAVDDLYGDGETRPKPLYGDAQRKEDEFELHMIDVGQGLSVLVRAPDGTCALIDAGDRDDGDTVTEYLRAQGVEKLKLLIATHAHADHIGGMADVVSEFPVERFVTAALPEDMQPTTKVYTDLLRAVADQGLKVTPAEPGTRYILGGAQLTLEGPLEEYGDLNDTSVVCRAVFGERAFLVTGDAEETAESGMLRRGRKLTSDVLIAGHHGSSTSSSQRFLSAVEPLYVGISCGADNKYGHPHEESLKRFEKMGCAVLRTDIEGSTIFYTDGESVHVAVANPAA